MQRNLFFFQASIHRQKKTKKPSHSWIHSFYSWQLLWHFIQSILWPFSGAQSIWKKNFLVSTLHFPYRSPEKDYRMYQLKCYNNRKEKRMHFWTTLGIKKNWKIKILNLTKKPFQNNSDIWSDFGKWVLTKNFSVLSCTYFILR